MDLIAVTVASAKHLYSLSVAMMIAGGALVFLHSAAATGAARMVSQAAVSVFVIGAFELGGDRDYEPAPADAARAAMVSGRTLGQVYAAPRAGRSPRSWVRQRRKAALDWRICAGDGISWSRVGARSCTKCDDRSSPKGSDSVLDGAGDSGAA